SIGQHYPGFVSVFVGGFGFVVGVLVVGVFCGLVFLGFWLGWGWVVFVCCWVLGWGLWGGVVLLLFFLVFGCVLFVGLLCLGCGGFGFVLGWFVGVGV
ncbi:hypothetical protein OVY84_24950, partial [Salmonella enterica subsp. enterica serovar 1,4,[5],12:i:-]|nr:hypothetical protein [Salmonella enterica subsp. enterica serovar 1,4,[5],12:i:-]